MKHLILFILLLFLSTFAQAQYVSTRLGPMLPYKGFYYDVNQAGSGLAVDYGLGADGKTYQMFLEFASYDANGNQVNYFITPTYSPSGETTMATTGVIGTANAGAGAVPFFVATNGQCPGCAPKSQTETNTPFVPTFTWTSSRSVTMTFPFNGTTYTYHLQAANFITANPLDDDKFIPGTYALSFVDDTGWVPLSVGYGNNLIGDLAIVNVQQAPFTSVRAAAGSSPSLVLPPAGAELFVVRCASVVPAVTSAGGNQCFGALSVLQDVNDSNGSDPIVDTALLWYDHSTGTAGFEVVHPDGTVGPASLTGQLNVNPNSLVAHLQMQGQNGNGTKFFAPGQIAWSFALTRLPDGTVRDCFDSNPLPNAGNNFTQFCR